MYMYKSLIGLYLNICNSTKIKNKKIKSLKEVCTCFDHSEKLFIWILSIYDAKQATFISSLYDFVNGHIHRDETIERSWK